MMLSLLVKLLSHLPFGVLYALSDGLFYVLYYIVRYRRGIVRRNLSESFPDKSKAEIVAIEKKFYRHFTDNMLETCKLATISREEISRRMRFVNMETVNAETRQGHSLSLFLGHYANWEWISSIPLHLDKGVIGAQIYHTLSNKAADTLMLKIRERMGAVNVEMRHTARFITRQVADGNVCMVGFIADHSPRRKDATHFLPFLHHCAPVITGPEKITKRYDYQAWFVDVRRVRRGYYEAEFVRMDANPRTLPDFELTTIYFRLLEQMIRRQPELYLWTHNRFKYAKPAAESPENTDF